MIILSDKAKILTIMILSVKLKPVMPTIFNGTQTPYLEVDSRAKKSFQIANSSAGEETATGKHDWHRCYLHHYNLFKQKGKEMGDMISFLQDMVCFLWSWNGSGGGVGVYIPIPGRSRRSEPWSLKFVDSMSLVSSVEFP